MFWAPCLQCWLRDHELSLRYNEGALSLSDPRVNQCPAQCLRHAESHKVDKWVDMWILLRVEVVLKFTLKQSVGMGTLKTEDLGIRPKLSYALSSRSPWSLVMSFARGALYVGQARCLSHASLSFTETRFCHCYHSFVCSFIHVFRFNKYFLHKYMSTMSMQCFPLKKIDKHLCPWGT